MKFRRSRIDDNRLHDYVAGDLDGNAAAEVEEQLAQDAEARARLEEVRAAHEALLALRERREPPVSAGDVLPAIQAAIAVERFQARPRLPLEGQGARFYRRLAAAALLLCALSLSLLALRSGEPEAPPQPVAKDRPPIEERIRMPMTAEEWLKLLEEEGVRPQDLTITFEDEVVPVSLDTAEPR